MITVKLLLQNIVFLWIKYLNIFRAESYKGESTWGWKQKLRLYHETLKCISMELHIILYRQSKWSGV